MRIQATWTQEEHNREEFRIEKFRLGVLGVIVAKISRLYRGDHHYSDTLAGEPRCRGNPGVSRRFEADGDIRVGGQCRPRCLLLIKIGVASPPNPDESPAIVCAVRLGGAACGQYLIPADSAAHPPSGLALSSPPKSTRRSVVPDIHQQGSELHRLPSSQPDVPTRWCSRSPHHQPPKS